MVEKQARGQKGSILKTHNKLSNNNTQRGSCRKWSNHHPQRSTNHTPTSQHIYKQPVLHISPRGCWVPHNTHMPICSHVTGCNIYSNIAGIKHRMLWRMTSSDGSTAQTNKHFNTQNVHKKSTNRKRRQHTNRTPTHHKHQHIAAYGACIATVTCYIMSSSRLVKQSCNTHTEHNRSTIHCGRQCWSETQCTQQQQQQQSISQIFQTCNK